MEVDFSKQIQDLKRGSGDSLIYSNAKDLDDNEILTIVNDLLESKAEYHNSKHEDKVSVDQLKKVYFRGSKSYETTHRVGKTRGQWAIARVNMFLKMNRGEDICDSYLMSDKDILISESDCIADKDVYPFFDFSDIDLNLASLDLVKAGIEKWNQDFHCEDIFFSEAEKKTLNKPFRLKGDKKKYGVYVKNPKTGNTILVKFGDPNMEIKRDDPERRRSFRARHKCDTAKDKTTPRYWSCKFWSKKPVSKMVSSDAVEWDDEEILTEWGWDDESFLPEDHFEDQDHLKNCEIIEEDGI